MFQPSFKTDRSTIERLNFKTEKTLEIFPNDFKNLHLNKEVTINGFGSFFLKIIFRSMINFHVWFDNWKSDFSIQTHIFLIEYFLVHLFADFKTKMLSLLYRTMRRKFFRSSFMFQCSKKFPPLPPPTPFFRQGKQINSVFSLKIIFSYIKV